MTYVLYHNNCYDGFGAAYAAWKKFGDSAAYKAVSYGEPFPELPQGRIYILDFSYPKDVMLSAAETHKLIVIDHHKTAQENFVGLEHPNIEAHFNMDKSGARMAWEYFHQVGGVIGGDEVPMLIQHIEDRDLWRFKLEKSKEIHKALVSYPMDFYLWDSFDIEKLKVEGVALERMYTQLVENICTSSWIGKIGDDDVPMVNTSIAWSEIGEALKKKYPDAKYVASFTEFEKEVMWSLRSREDFDCSDVAKRFGGGGHRQAAGFKIKK